MKTLSKIVVVAMITLVVVSCTKEIVVKECPKRHAVSIKVNALPSGIDLFSNPDLRCDISPYASQYWAYYSNSVDNVSGLPVTIYFPEPVLFSQEEWSLRLVDEDVGADDEIYYSDFNPYSEVSNEGVISFQLEDGTIAFELNFTESE